MESSEEEEEEEFVPESDEEEESKPSVQRRKSAPTRGSSAAAKTSAPSRPTRAQSAAASSSDAAAASSSTATTQAARRMKKPASTVAATAAAAATAGSKRKKKAVSSSEDEDEDEEEESSQEDDEAEQASEPSSSSDDEDAAQCSALRKTKPAKVARKSKESDAGAAAAAACSSSEKDSPMSKKKSSQRGRSKGKKKKCGDDGDECDDGDAPVRSSARSGGESLLEHFQRLRALYEPPQGACFEDAFAAQDLQDKAKAASTTAPKRSKAAAAKAAAAASSSAAAVAAAAAAAAAPAVAPFPDFVARLPQSLAQLTFTFLNPVTVARSERVCRMWRDTLQQGQGAGVYKSLFGSFFPLLRRIKDAELRRQDSDVDPALLTQRAAASSAFFATPNPQGMTAWAARRSEGGKALALPVFNPHANDKLGLVRSPADREQETQGAEQRLQPKQGTFHWKHSFVNRLAATCVECRSLCMDVYKLTNTRVCIDCAMHHPQGRYDVVNSGCAKGKSLLLDRELATLPSVTEFDPHDDGKTVFFMLAMVLAMRHLKFGGPQAFQREWAERIAKAQQRFVDRREKGLTTKKQIPKIYRDNVGSTPEKTKGHRADFPAARGTSAQTCMRIAHHCGMCVLCD